jgi:branched-chain amino acid transport system substrate-binding protein
MPSHPQRSRRRVLALAAALLGGAFAPAAFADGKVTVGVILPLSGAFADQGKHYETGMQLYQQTYGATAAGKTVDLVVRDDQGPASGDLSRRLTQELILRDHADLIVGYSFTPNAMSAASLLTQAKKPAIIINAATSIITAKSPYFTRISMTMSQVTYALGQWAAKNGIKTAYTIVSDYAPGIDAETWFTKGFTSAGGKVLGADRTPLASVEYGAVLQRAIEAKPDAVFSFDPGGDVAIAFMKQATERLAGTGIKLMATGDVVDENLLPAMGDKIGGVISAFHYQTDLDNPANKKFLEVYHAKFGAKASPSYRVVQGWDAMDLIYKTLAKTGGAVDADAFMAALKGMKLDSPRGPVEIDPATRDIVQNIYIRRTEIVDGTPRNASFATIKAVKDPAK